MTISDDPTQQWSALQDHMEGFLEAWETGDNPPTIAEHLPQGNLALQVVAVVELIKIDLDHRHARNLWHPLEWYAQKYPEMLHAGEPPIDLIYEEFQVRKSAGEEVSPQEYFERFPKNREALGRLLNCYDLQHTTSLAAGKPKEQFQPGDSLDDFDLLTRLGSGAFANVFLARQKSMQRLVALKVSADKGIEGQTLAQLEHPHIVRVYDQRRLPERKLRLLYMQYAPGGSLQDAVYRVRRTPPAERTGQLLIETVDEALQRAGYDPPESSAHRRRVGQGTWPETVCRIGIQLAQALDYAHRRGILHRDVKPANVLLTAECTAKLADFNISFASQLDGASPAAYFGGSMAYMSPEQLEACNPEHERQPDSLDGRADLFSLAAMLWELLYGARPFSDEGLTGSWSSTLLELTRRRRTEQPRWPETVRPDELTRSITQVLTKALAPDSEQRHPDGAEMARELALCLQPKAKQLLEVPRGGLRRFARAWPLVAAILVILLPNIGAAIFNFFYNLYTIVPEIARLEAGKPGPHLSEVEILAIFYRVCTILNSVYFALGAVLVWLIIGPAASMVTAVNPDPERVIRARSRSLYLGHVAAAFGTVLWLTSGITFPAAMHLNVGAMQPIYKYFFASMTLCGLIAAAYPYLLTTYLVTHVFYPVMLRQAPTTEEDERQLAAVPEQWAFYQACAVLVPFMGMGMFIFRGIEQTAAHQAALIALILSGILGFIAARWIHKKIEQDIAALLAAIRPIDASSMTDTAIAFSATRTSGTKTSKG